MNKHATVQDLATETRDLLSHCGVAEAVFSARQGMTVRSPINGQAIARIAEAGRRGRGGGSRPRPRGLPRLAPCAGAEARRAGAPARRGAAHEQGRARPPRLHRGRQDRLRGARRSPGDDRHLRFRGRPVAPALRPHHRHRAPVAPHDGDLASARRRRRHLGLQLPGRGVVVERRARPGLRRFASSGSRRRRRRSPRLPCRRCSSAPCSAIATTATGARPSVGSADRRPRRRRGAGRRPARPPGLGDRFDRDGPRRRAAARRALRPRHPRAWRQQRAPSSRPRPISTWPCAPSPSRRMGTAGQRCTTLRRLFVHDSVYDALVPQLKRAYQSVTIGNPLEQGTLVGPLIDAAACDQRWMPPSTPRARHGGAVTGGEREIAARPGERPLSSRPALVEMPEQTGPVVEETFAPILYVMRYTELDGRRSPSTTPCRRACRRRSSPPICARPSSSSRPRLRLRHRQRQHRPLRRRDRRRLRRRKGDRRRPRSRLGRLEGLHAPRHQHHQLRQHPAARAGRDVRHRLGFGEPAEQPVETGKARIGGFAARSVGLVDECIDRAGRMSAGRAS